MGRQSLRRNDPDPEFAPNSVAVFASKTAFPSLDATPKLRP
jgi:hypothetical protein